MCRVGNQEGEILSGGGGRLAVEKRVEGWKSRIVGRVADGRWSRDPTGRQGRDGWVKICGW